MSVPLIPVNGYVLIEPIKETAGTLELAQTADKKPQKGKVVAIASDTDKSDFGITWDCPCQIGDIVTYKNWGSEIYHYNNLDYVTVRFRDINLIINETTD